MIEWSESQLMIRDAVRKFMTDEVEPHVEALEHGDMPPYEILRKMYATFGMNEMARSRFQKQIAAEKEGKGSSRPKKDSGDSNARADQAAAQLTPKSSRSSG